MNTLFGFIQNMGPGQIILILAIVLLLFGGKKLPGLARSVGQSLNEFKKGKAEGAKEMLPENEATAASAKSEDLKQEV